MHKEKLKQITNKMEQEDASESEEEEEDQEKEKEKKPAQMMFSKVVAGKEVVE